MQHLHNKTDQLIVKARKLAGENHKLRETNQNLESELKKLRQLFEAEGQKNAELNNKIKIIKLAQNISSVEGAESGQSAELKRKINEYIREIDNCIAMLNE
jgi:hypothetical protein